MESMDAFFKYIWMAVVAIIGATVGFISKVSPTLHGKALKDRIRVYILGLITSMFVAYITYELSFYFVKSDRLAVALAGLASFAGTDILVIFQQKIVEVIKRKFDRI